MLFLFMTFIIFVVVRVTKRFPTDRHSKYRQYTILSQFHPSATRGNYSKVFTHISVLQVAGLRRILILLYAFIASHMRAMCLTETYILQFSNIYE
jgi:hypothetical protein